jgi:hypothetical protein
MDVGWGKKGREEQSISPSERNSSLTRSQGGNESNNKRNNV